MQLLRSRWLFLVRYWTVRKLTLTYIPLLNPPPLQTRCLQPSLNYTLVRADLNYIFLVNSLCSVTQQLRCWLLKMARWFNISFRPPSHSHDSCCREKHYYLVPSLKSWVHHCKPSPIPCSYWESKSSIPDIAQWRSRSNRCVTDTSLACHVFVGWGTTEALLAYPTIGKWSVPYN